MLLVVVHWVSDVKLIFILAYYIIHQNTEYNSNTAGRAKS